MDTKKSMFNKKNKYNVCVLITSDNDETLIEETIQSVKKQTYKNTFITVVDNKSLDKTYEKVLSLIDEKCSGYQLKEKVLKEEFIPSSVKILKNYLDFISFVVIIKPGDILYPDYISQCINLASKNNYEIDMIATEVDIQIKDNIFIQRPLYRRKCKIKYEVLLNERYNYGYNHRIVNMYKLSNFNKCFFGTRDFFTTYWIGSNEWINTHTPLNGILYNNKKGGIIKEITKFQVKNKMLEDYAIAIINSYPSFAGIKKEDKMIFSNIIFSKRALYYASLALHFADFDNASDGILIAEMFNSDIINEKEYQLINKKIKEKISLPYNIIETMFPLGEEKRPPKSTFS